jgi:hypothetical protein
MCLASLCLFYDWRKFLINFPQKPFGVSNHQSLIVMIQVLLLVNNPLPVVWDWHISSNDICRDRDPNWERISLLRVTKQSRGRPLISFVHICS